jgi:hypothetical protein
MIVGNQISLCYAFPDFAADITYLNGTIADFKILFLGAFLTFDFCPVAAW